MNLRRGSRSPLGAGPRGAISEPRPACMAATGSPKGRWRLTQSEPALMRPASRQQPSSPHIGHPVRSAEEACIARVLTGSRPCPTITDDSPRTRYHQTVRALFRVRTWRSQQPEAIAMSATVKSVFDATTGDSSPEGSCPSSTSNTREALAIQVRATIEGSSGVPVGRSIRPRAWCPRVHRWRCPEIPAVACHSAIARTPGEPPREASEPGAEWHAKRPGKVESSWRREARHLQEKDP